MPELPPFVNGFVDRDQLVLLYRDDAGTLMQKRVPAEYSCFYEKKRVDELEIFSEIKKNRFVRGVSEEGKWLRVRWTDHWVRRKACSSESPFQGRGLFNYEGDVDPVARFFADTGAKIARPRRCFVDLETDSRVSPRLAAEGEARILSWVVVDDLERVEIGCIEADTDAEEKELIEAFYDAIGGYDQVIAWNGDGFDFPVLAERAKRRRASIKDTRRWLWLDQMVLFERMNRNAAESGAEKVSLKLGSVCQEILGEGKEEFDARRTYDAWEDKGKYKSREEMLSYMVKDALLQVRLEKKVGHLDLHQAISEVCGVFPDSRGMNPTRFVDAYMLRVGAQKGYRFPTRNFDREEEEQFKGAWVMEPKCRGFAENVHVGDFKSLYPSIIITWNMSPETKHRTCPTSGPIPPDCARSPSNRVGFRTDVVGILPGAVAELIHLRDYYKKLKTQLPPGTPEWKDADRKSMAYKVAANSFYGVMGSPFSRFFDRDIAEGVAQNGVWLIKKTSEAAASPRWKMDTIYGDTDSLFIVGQARERFNEFVTWCNAELYPQILKETGVVDNRISFAYEKEFLRLVMTSAKKYTSAMVHYGWDSKKGDWNWGTEKSKPEVRGLEWKRGDTNKIARAMQWDAIQLIASRDAMLARDPAKYVEVIERYKTRVLEAELDVDEVKQGKALSKKLNEYEAKPKKDGSPSAIQAHVSVAKILYDRGENIVVNSKIDYVISDGSKDESNGLVAIPASDYDGKNVDRFYLWEHMVWPPMQRLVEAAFPDHDWKAYNRLRPTKRERVAARAGQALLFLVK